MDLIAKVGILIIVVVALFAAASMLFAQGHPRSGIVNQTQAEQFILADMKTANPNASVTIVSVAPSALENNSWGVTLAVIYNATRPCPTLFIEGFDYPALGLSPSTDNLYTRGCVIYGLTTAPSYVISSPMIAIARSYNASPAARSYASAFGYNNTAVHAAFYPVLQKSSTPLNMTGANIWLINYSATTANYNLFVLLSQSGAVSANYTQHK